MPVRFRESSFSIFFRKDFSFPAKLEPVSDRVRVTLFRDTEEWYRGRASASSSVTFETTGAEGSVGKVTEPRFACLSDEFGIPGIGSGVGIRSEEVERIDDGGVSSGIWVVIGGARC